MTTVTLPISRPCVTGPSAESAKNRTYTKITAEMTYRTSHRGRGIRPSAPCTRSMRACSRVGRLVHPPVVRGLLDVGLRLDGLDGLEQRRTPRVERVAQRAVLHPRPLDADDGPGVADELAGELLAHVGGQELGGLHLLRDRDGLGLRTGARLVVGLERQEDDEPEQDREARRQHPEHAGRAVPVAEVAALRCAPPHQEHRGHGERVTPSVISAPTTMFMRQGSRGGRCRGTCSR